MSGVYGYFISTTDLIHWLHTARVSMITKAKIRRALWSDLNECVQTYVPADHYVDYVRIPHSHYVLIHTLCYTSGKGAEDLSCDQMVSFITTLDELLQLVARHERFMLMRRLACNSVVEGDYQVDAGDAKHENVDASHTGRSHPAE
jgi:hypothetical protein